MAGLIWKTVATGGSVATGLLANKVLGAVWRRARHGDDPPLNPESDETSWAEAVAWAVVSGVVVGVARLAFRRNAAGYYRRSTGHLPAGLEDAG